MKGLTFMGWSKYGVTVANSLKMGPIITGLAWAFSATLAACAAMCAWVLLSAGQVFNLSAFIAAGSVFGALLGGAASGKAAGTMGMLHGFATGLFYGLLASLLISGTAGSFFAGLAARTAVLGIAGSIGGLIGVNLHQSRRIRGKRRLARYFP